jgi:hypothetical protein
MKITATRTLMKSAPELWELLDDEPQLRHWSERLCDSGGAVEVTAREPGRLLVWRCDSVKVKVKLVEKGFGTQVAIAAKAQDGLKEAHLDEVLDELAEPQRRPFSGV